MSERERFEAWAEAWGAMNEHHRYAAWEAWQAALAAPAASEPLAWFYEDELPKRISQQQYDDWFPSSRVIMGVRMFPLYAHPAPVAAPAPAAPAPDDARDAARYRWLRSASMDRGSIPYDNWWEKLGDRLDEDFDAAIDAAMKEKP